MNSYRSLRKAVSIGWVRINQHSTARDLDAFNRAHAGTQEYEQARSKLVEYYAESWNGRAGPKTTGEETTISSLPRPPIKRALALLHSRDRLSHIFSSDTAKPVWSRRAQPDLGRRHTAIWPRNTLRRRRTLPLSRCPDGAGSDASRITESALLQHARPLGKTERPDPLMIVGD